MTKVFAVLFGASLLFASCTDGAAANDGENASARLSKGHTANSSSKFWGACVPSYGIQVWGLPPKEAWGASPDMDFETGKFTGVTGGAGIYNIVIGAFNTKYSKYITSHLKTFECDVWTESDESGVEFTINVFHAADNKVTLTKEVQHVSVPLNPPDTKDILLYLAWANTNDNFIVHMENAQFLDKDGNAVADIPFLFEPDEEDE